MASVKITTNGFGLGAVVSACAWGNCAKPVLAAGGIIQHSSLIGTPKKVF